MLLEKLCNSIAPSGYEGDTRNLIKAELKNKGLNFSIDNIGNILANKKKPEIKSDLKVMIAAHMDEIGLIITAYNSDGTLKFSTLGYIDVNSLPCKTVLIGKNRIKGVIGLKPIHLQTEEERIHAVSLHDLCIDIGTSSKEETKEVVSLGDFVGFNINFEKFSDNIVKAKALNDRIGCSVLLEILNEEYDCDLYASFNVQENIGERGTFISNYNVNPDVFILIDTICTSDIMTAPGSLESNVSLGNGPVIPFKAGSSVFDTKSIKHIREIAAESNIKYQKVAVTKFAGQSISAQLTNSSINVSAILIPCRYMNSVVSICNLNDYRKTVELLKKYIKLF